MRMSRPPVRWGRRERGATAVIVAITATALLGMAAISVDYAAASSKRHEVQAAADAAALEIARDCFAGEAACQSSGPGKAQWYADEVDGQVKSFSVDTANDMVKVSLEADTQTLFAKAAFGSGASAQTSSSASAKAKYIAGTVIEYKPMYPLAFEYCKFKSAGSGDNWYQIRNIPLVSQSNPPTNCPDPRDNTTLNMDGPHDGVALITNGAFGFNDNCELDPGRTMRVWEHYLDTALGFVLDIKLGCRNKFLNLKPGDLILVPIYASYKTKSLGVWWPQNPSVRIVGFAPFKIADTKPFYDRELLIFNVRRDYCSLGIGLLGGLIETGCYRILGRFVQTNEIFPDAKYGTEVDGVPAPNLGANGAIVKLVP